MKTIVISAAILLLFSLSASRRPPKDNCGSYRWAVKTLTDPGGKSVFGMTPTSTTMEALVNATRTAPDRESDENNRYADEKKIVKIEVTIKEIKQEKLDHDFHIVLMSGNYTMVGEIPDGGGCSVFSSHPALAKHFDDLRTLVVNKIGFTPGEGLRQVGIKATIEGVPFWDEMSADHKPTGSAANQHEIHPIISVTFH